MRKLSKYLILFFTLSLLIISTVPGFSALYANPTSYNVGDIGPAGGFIIYVNGNNYLEAAPTDQAPIFKWSNITNVAAGAWDATIGAGQSNTNIIIHQPGHLSSAAQECDDLVITNNSVNYDDGIYSQENEFDLIHTNVWLKNKGGLAGLSGIYWTSTEYSYYQAWIYTINSGWAGGANKNAEPRRLMLGLSDLFH